MSWLIVLIAFGLVVFPIVKILQKAGFSGWLAVLALIPLANLIGLWLFAMLPWPNQKAVAKEDVF
jgi:uncharacterized membrane protein YhaH (DUF805 family)